MKIYKKLTTFILTIVLSISSAQFNISAAYVDEFNTIEILENVETVPEDAVLNGTEMSEISSDTENSEIDEISGDTENLETDKVSDETDETEQLDGFVTDEISDDVEEQEENDETLNSIDWYIPDEKPQILVKYKDYNLSKDTIKNIKQKVKSRKSVVF